jgi:hypothetical protein
VTFDHDEVVNGTSVIFELFVGVTVAYVAFDNDEVVSGTSVIIELVVGITVA